MIDPILALFLEKERFFITTHVRPDGDAIGSQLALGQFLQKLGKQVSMINHDPAPDNVGWLPGCDLVEVFDGALRQRELINKAEVILMVDTNALDRVGAVSTAIQGSAATKILIDHHTEPETWFDHMFVQDTASSAAEMVYELITAFEKKHPRISNLIDYEIATALYAGIVTDTGSFRYSSVTPAVHRITADLMERGSLRPDEIHGALYDTRSPESIRLLAKVLETLTMRFEGILSYMVVSQRMLREQNASYDDTEGIVGFGLSIDGVRVALTFAETSLGIKISFRSKGDLHVNEWARAFGGGGHRNASGAFVKRPLDEVVTSVLAAAPRYLRLPETDAQDHPDVSSEDAAYLSTLLHLKAQR